MTAINFARACYFLRVLPTSCLLIEIRSLVARFGSRFRSGLEPSEFSLIEEETTWQTFRSLLLLPQRRRAYQMRCVSRKRVSSYLAVSGRNNCFQLRSARFRVISKKFDVLPSTSLSHEHELPLRRLYHRKMQTRSVTAKGNIYSLGIEYRNAVLSERGPIEFALDSWSGFT